MVSLLISRPIFVTPLDVLEDFTFQLHFVSTLFFFISSRSHFLHLRDARVFTIASARAVSPRLFRYYSSLSLFLFHDIPIFSTTFDPRRSRSSRPRSVPIISPFPTHFNFREIDSYPLFSTVIYCLVPSSTRISYLPAFKIDVERILVYGQWLSSSFRVLVIFISILTSIYFCVPVTFVTSVECIF